jgi:hypothetical protein
MNLHADMNLHHGLDDAHDLLRDAAAFLQSQLDELGRVPLTDLVKSCTTTARKLPSCRGTSSLMGSCLPFRPIQT